MTGSCDRHPSLPPDDLRSAPFEKETRTMRAVMMYGTHDVRVEDRADPVLLADTDAIIKVAASCVCGSDLWPYRGTDPITEPTPMGHEYVGVVQQIGSEVK